MTSDETNGVDFRLPFLPEALAGARAVPFLTDEERLVLNQVRGHEYLVLRTIAEGFGLAEVVGRLAHALDDADPRVRALVDRVGAVDAPPEHDGLRRLVELGLGTRCDTIGPRDAVVSAVLSHDPLAVALTLLHLAWVGQQHQLACLREELAVEPRFAALLRHHARLEEPRLASLLVRVLSEGRTEEEVLGSVEGYLDIVGFLDNGLAQQVDLNLDALQRATGRILDERERRTYRATQLRALRWCWLGAGMTHPAVLSALQALHPLARERVEAVSPAWC